MGEVVTCLHQSLHLLDVHRGRGVEAHPVQAANKVGVMAVNETHPEAGQAEVLAKTPENMGAGGVRKLRTVAVAAA